MSLLALFYAAAFYLFGVPNAPAHEGPGVTSGVIEHPVSAPPDSVMCWQPVFAQGTSLDDEARAMMVLESRALLYGHWAVAMTLPNELALDRPLPEFARQTGQLQMAPVQSGGRGDAPKGAWPFENGWVQLGPVQEMAIATATHSVDQNGNPAVEISFTPETARIFADLTASVAADQGKLAMAVDGRVLTVPRVLTQLSGGVAMISGLESDQDAADLALVLATGPLSAEIVEWNGPVPCGAWIEHWKD